MHTSQELIRGPQCAAASRQDSQGRMLSTTTALFLAPCLFLHGSHPAKRCALRATTVVACDDPTEAAPTASQVVEAQLQALQRGEAGLRDAHNFMSPAYHARPDALERFSGWFASPFYEVLLECASWKIFTPVSMRDETFEQLLSDGTTFFGSRSVEQVVKARVTAGRPKWAESGFTGTRAGQQMADSSFLFTLSLEGDQWTIDHIAPEEPVRIPSDIQRLRGGALCHELQRCGRGRAGAVVMASDSDGSDSSSGSSRRGVLLGVPLAVSALAAARIATVDSVPLSWEGPIRSYENFVSLKGKTVLITGATAGIGYETAARLAEEGATLIIAGRSAEKLRDSAESIRERARAAGGRAEGGAVETLEVDLASLASVRRMAASFKQSHKQLDVLILNAGVSSLPQRTLTEDGLEMQFQVNYLSHFLMTNLLIDELRAAPAPRILSVASVASYLPTAAVQLDDLQRGRPGSYGSCTTPVDCFSYHQSKNAQLLFTRELQRRLGGSESRATAVSVHPGLVVTPVLFGGAWGAAGHFFRFTRVMQEPSGGAASAELRALEPDSARRLQLLTGLKTPRQGAQTSVWAATAPEINASRFGGRFLREVADAEAEARLIAPGYGDDALGLQLWQRAEALSGAPFNPSPML